MLTIERRMILEPSDILALRLTCQGCLASVSLKLDQTISMPSLCSNCQTAWVVEAVNAFDHLAATLKQWARAEKELSPRVRIGFEFQAPPKP